MQVTHSRAIRVAHSLAKSSMPFKAGYVLYSQSVPLRTVATSSVTASKTTGRLAGRQLSTRSSTTSSLTSHSSTTHTESKSACGLRVSLAGPSFEGSVSLLILNVFVRCTYMISQGSKPVDRSCLPQHISTADELALTDFNFDDMAEYILPDVAPSDSACSGTELPAVTSDNDPATTEKESDKSEHCLATEHAQLAPPPWLDTESVHSSTSSDLDAAEGAESAWTSMASLVEAPCSSEFGSEWSSIASQSAESIQSITSEFSRASRSDASWSSFDIPRRGLVKSTSSFKTRTSSSSEGSAESETSGTSSVSSRVARVGRRIGKAVSGMFRTKKQKGVICEPVSSTGSLRGSSADVPVSSACSAASSQAAVQPAEPRPSLVGKVLTKVRPRIDKRLPESAFGRGLLKFFGKAQPGEAQAAESKALEEWKVWHERHVASVAHQSAVKESERKARELEKGRLRQQRRREKARARQVCLLTTTACSRSHPRRASTTYSSQRTIQLNPATLVRQNAHDLIASSRSCSAPSIAILAGAGASTSMWTQRR